MIEIDNPVAEMNHEEIERVAARLIEKNKISQARDGTSTSLLLLGKPGIGKSHIFRSLAGKHGMGYYEERLSYKNPVDVTGWPYVMPGEDRLRMAIPPNYPVDCGPVIFHLEEINLASQETLRAAQQLLLENRIGEYRLPEGSLVVASGNRVDDYADVVSFGSAMIDRVAMFQLTCDPVHWVGWATDHGLHPLVISLIRFFPNLLHTLPDAEDGWDRQTQFATPRSWEAYSDILKTYNGFPDMLSRRDLFQREAKGFVGHVAASQLVNTLEIAGSMPTLEQIIENPHGVAPPEELVHKVIACSILAMGINKGNCGPVVAYASRPEFGSEVKRYFLNLVMGLHKDSSSWKPFYNATRSTKDDYAGIYA